MARPTGTAYSASEGAVMLLTKSMAIDHGHENIRRNAIRPSFVETDLTAAVMSKAPDPDAVPREPIGVHLIGRLDRPEAIAGLAVYLASDESWLGHGRGISSGWRTIGSGSLLNAKKSQPKTDNGESRPDK